MKTILTNTDPMQYVLNCLHVLETDTDYVKERGYGTAAKTLNAHDKNDKFWEDYELLYGFTIPHVKKEMEVWAPEGYEWEEKDGKGQYVRKGRLALYAWMNAEIFCNWSCGYAFALAHSKEEAIDLILKTEKAEFYNLELRKDLEETEPVVSYEPIAYAISGSE